MLQTERTYVLRTTETTWSAALSQSLREPDCCYAVGSLDCLTSAQANLLCLRELQSSRTAPQGQDRAELESWCVIVWMDRLTSPWSAEQISNRFRPRHAQQLVVLCVDAQSPTAGWSGWIVERGEIRRLDGFQIVGRNPVISERQVSSSDRSGLDIPNEDRYSRLQPVLGSTYNAVRRATVLLIGASRSGSVAAMELAALGIARLIQIDPDLVETHNLDGMFWATPADIGRSKAVVNGQRLHQYRPDMAIHPLTVSIRDANLRLPALCDLMVSCVDDEIARRHAARLASRWLLPHLDIATQVTAVGARMNPESAAEPARLESSTGRELRADVRLILPGEGCLVCVGGQATKEMENFERFAPLSSLTPDQMQPWNQQRLGSLVTLNALAVSVGIQTWLQYQSGELAGSIWHRLTWRSPTDLAIESGYVRGRQPCEHCVIR